MRGTLREKIAGRVSPFVASAARERSDGSGSGAHPGADRGSRSTLALRAVSLVFVLLIAWGIIDRGPLLLQSAIITAVAYSMLAMGTNVIFGWSGLFPFGQAAVFGAGAYAAALVGPHVGEAPIVLVIAGLVGCGAELCMMAGFGRFSSISFGMLTLVASEVVAQFATTSNSLGAVNDGIYGVPRGTVFGLSLNSGTAFWWYSIAVLVICTAGYLALGRSTFRLWLNAIRDDAGRVATLRRSTYLTRCAASIPAGLLCGIGGGLYVQFSGAATPFVLDFSISGIALFMCLIGGRDNALGPLVGAFIYNIVTQYFLYGNNYPDIFTGGALMVVVVLLPGGLMSLPSIARAQRRRRASRGTAARHPANDTTE
jgi:branched-chain amino acid transport system permease protein